jgi:hypothetical protein
MTTLLRNLWNDDQGQDLIEYTLLMAFVALASAALFISSGKQRQQDLEHDQQSVERRGRFRRQLEVTAPGAPLPGRSWHCSGGAGALVTGLVVCKN